MTVYRRANANIRNRFLSMKLEHCSEPVIPTHTELVNSISIYYHPCIKLKRTNNMTLMTKFLSFTGSDAQ